MLYGNETWPVKGHDVMALERNERRIVRWLYYIRPEARIFAVVYGR